MKVVTKSVIIEGKEFVLIKDTDKNYGEFYGTIPYTEIDEDGKMKRELNGFEICMERTVGKALERRKDSIMRERKMNVYLSMGFDKMTAILKACGCA